jgi:hypothetical protein
MVSCQVAVPGWQRRQLRFGVGVDVAVGVRAVAFSAEPLLTAGVGVGVGSAAVVVFPAVALPDAAVVRGTGGGPVAGRHWPPPRRDGAAARARWEAANPRSAGAKAMPVAESARSAASAERIAWLHVACPASHLWSATHVRACSRAPQELHVGHEDEERHRQGKDCSAASSTRCARSAAAPGL